MLLILFSILTFSTSVLGINSPDVVGGTNRIETWIVSLQIAEKDFAYCGATLIHSELLEFEKETNMTVCSGWVITSASCLQDIPNILYATLGNFDLKGDDVNKTDLELVKPFHFTDGNNTYNENTHENDIGLIQVRFRQENIPNETEAKTFCDDYPVLNYKHDRELNESHYENINATVYGWGLKFENGRLPTQLNNATVKLMSDKDCMEKYKETRLEKLFQENMKGANCAGGSGRGACSYDTGGPLKCDYKGPGDENVTTYLCGIASFGSGCDLPAVFTDVSSFVEWIDEVIGNKKLSNLK